MEDLKPYRRSDGIIDCYVNITTEEWLAILKKGLADDLCFQYLHAFLRAKDHRSTCKEISQMSKRWKSSSINAKIVDFAKKSQSELNRFHVTRDNGNPTYWVIPMTGRELQDGLFEWRLRDELAEAIKEYLQWLRSEFVKAFPISSLSRMKLSDYTNLNRDGSFCYWVELRLKGLGGIQGATAFKFGIYEYESQPESNPKQYLYDDKYAWQARFGDNAKDAFVNVRKMVKDVAVAAEKGNYEAIDKIELSPMFKWKIAYLYGNMEIVPIFKEEMLQKAAESRGMNNAYSASFAEIQRYLMGQFSGNDRLEYYFSLLREANKYDNDEIIKSDNEVMNKKEHDSYIEHLRRCKNIVLTGAPGTGKTYMAKAIAKEMGAESCFVQFHPSYDYTDFVEGLRPIKDENGNVGFERVDGVFKAFCAKAAQNAIDSEKTVETLEKEMSIKDRIENYLSDLVENSKMLSTKTGTNFHVVYFNEKTISIEMPDNNISTKLQLGMSDIVELLEKDVPLNNVKDIKTYFGRQFNTQNDSYTFVLCNEIKKISGSVKKTVHLVEKKEYVFIIDEINRGEISKIFGELFFAVDPGYRGTKGLVKTQYQNMVTDRPFSEGFYVPDNVYIIGTMNDIDRSVESMDFAIRRRFAWVEVEASDTAERILKDKPYKDEALKRMKNINNTIEEILGGKAYQIGASYFLKLDDYDEDFNKLWNFHLKSLMNEYLRGIRDASSKMLTLEKSYNA